MDKIKEPLTDLGEFYTNELETCFIASL